MKKLLSFLCIFILLSCSQDPPDADGDGIIDSVDECPQLPGTVQYQGCPSYSLSVNINPSEGGTVSPLSGQHKHGSNVTLTASPNNNYEFANWSGDGSGTNSTLVVNMINNKSIVANFGLKKFDLNIEIEGEGTFTKKIVEGKEVGNSQYVINSLVELTASPSEGWKFVEWEVNGEKNNQETIEIRFDKSYQIKLKFVAKTVHKLSLDIVGNGVVNKRIIKQGSTEDSEHYENTVIELTAVPDQNWVFYGFGGYHSSNNPITITLTQPTTISVLFRPVQYRLSYEVTGGVATITHKNKANGQSSSDNKYDFNSQVIIEAEQIDDQAYSFVKWDGDISGTDNPVTITMDKDKSFKAILEKKQYSFNVEKKGDSSNNIKTEIVAGKKIDGKYEYGTTLKVTAEPTDGWEFYKWEGIYEDVSNKFQKEINVTINDDLNIVAVFKKKFELTLFTKSPQGNGTGGTLSSSSISGGNPYCRCILDGEVIEVIATPNNDYSFKEWTGDSSGNENPLEVLINENKEITAVFDTPFYTDKNGTRKAHTWAKVGDKGVEYGTTYTIVDRQLLDEMISRNEKIFVVTTFINNMDDLFNGKEASGFFARWDVSNVTSMSRMFQHSKIVEYAAPVRGTRLWDVSKVTKMDHMFYNAGGITASDKWDVGKVTTMREMFRDHSMNIDLGNWDVSNVTDMKGMFRGSENFNKDISNWDVSNVTDMSNMFSHTNSFDQEIGNWNVSNVENMESMFAAAKKFNQDINNWDVSKVVNMTSMFSGAKLFNQTINNWNVKNVKYMDFMFMSNNFNSPIGNWNTSNVISMRYMFYESKSFNQDIGTWDVSSVEDFYSMFVDADSFNKSINNWDVSNVKNMSNMFSGADSFNQKLNNWNVSNVEDFSNMFSYTKFNQDISDWNLESATNLKQMFYDNTEFNQDLPNWNTSYVTDFDRMFQGSVNFNGKLDNWKFDSTESLFALFAGASSFNQDISSWNVKSISDMRYLFDRASSFNQDLTKWCVEKISSEPQRFSSESGLSQSNKPKWGTCPD